MIGFSPSSVPLRRTGPRTAETYAPFYFLSPTLGGIEVPVGFDTDYASIPRPFWSLYPPDGAYTEAAVIHDYLYWYQSVRDKPITRKQADIAFLEGMTVLDIPWARRHIIYRSVRLGGWIAWNKNTKLRKQNEV